MVEHLESRIFSRLVICLLLCFWTVIPVMGQQLASAPMQGHTTANSFKIWCMAKDVDQIQLRLRQGEKTINKKTIDVSGIQFWKDYAPFQAEFIRLEPETSYQLSISLDGEEVEETYELSTFPVEVKEQYSFLIGSCAFFVTGGWKLLWQNRNKAMKTMADVEGDFMVWLGDNNYMLFGEWDDKERMQKKFTTMRLHKKFNRFFTSRPQYATWDDHDFGPDNSDGTFANKDATLANFQSFWPNPYFGTDETPGVFSHFKYMDSEIFLLDDRYHRIDSARQQILGPEQMAWLKERLSASTATFKFIVHGSQVLNDLNAYECFAMYDERQILFDYIRDQEVEGVVFLSGDRHYTELLKMEQEGGYPFYEFTNSPLTAFLKRAMNREKFVEHNNPLRVPGTLVVERNFGSVDISGPLDDRVCTLRTFDNSGNLEWEYEIKARELRFPD